MPTCEDGYRTQRIDDLMDGATVVAFAQSLKEMCVGSSDVVLEQMSDAVEIIEFYLAHWTVSANTLHAGYDETVRRLLLEASALHLRWVAKHVPVAGGCAVPRPADEFGPDQQAIARAVLSVVGGAMDYRTCQDVASKLGINTDDIRILDAYIVEALYKGKKYKIEFNIGVTGILDARLSDEEDEDDG